MEGQINANIQHIGDCLQRYSTWGENHIVNICSGQNYTIPWGIDSYVTLACVLMMIIYLIAQLIKLR